VQGLAAKRDRDDRVVTPVYVVDEVTGNHTGADLAEIRERRPTPQRIGHLEERVDGVVATFGEFRAEHARDLGAVTSAVGALTGEVSGLKTVIENSARREHITFKSQVEVDTAQQLDVIDAGKIKRKWISQGFAIVVGLIGLASAAFAAGRC